MVTFLSSVLTWAIPKYSRYSLIFFYWNDSPTLTFLHNSALILFFLPHKETHTRLHSHKRTTWITHKSLTAPTSPIFSTQNETQYILRRATTSLLLHLSVVFKPAAIPPFIFPLGWCCDGWIHVFEAPRPFHTCSLPLYLFQQARELQRWPPQPTPHPVSLLPLSPIGGWGYTSTNWHRCCACLYMYWF